MLPAAQPLSRLPAFADRLLNAAFRGGAWAGAFVVLAALAGCVAFVAWQAAPGFRQFGLAPLWGSVWDANRDVYGLWPAIAGSALSSLLALALAAVLGFGIAILLTQGFLPRGVATALGHTIDLMAGVPSVVYGLWGVLVLGPALKPIAGWLHQRLGGLPFFATEYEGLGMLPAALVLAAMVLPTVTAVARDALASVPGSLRDAALALGATRWETILRVLLPAAKSGLTGALVLGFGRALGETMALAMLIGNQHAASWSLLSPATTLAALVALKFPEASGLELSMLMYAAATLLALTMLVNAAGNAIVGGAARMERREERHARRRA
jgi:phosphate transport system permease protein